MKHSNEKIDIYTTIDGRKFLNKTQAQTHENNIKQHINQHVFHVEHNPKNATFTTNTAFIAENEACVLHYIFNNISQSPVTDRNGKPSKAYNITNPSKTNNHPKSNNKSEQNHEYELSLIVLANFIQIYTESNTPIIVLNQYGDIDIESTEALKP